MSNWIADQVGSAAGWLTYAFGGGSAEQARGDQLDAQLAKLNNAEYGSGGRIYNEIAAANGISAADQARLQVQTNLDTGKTGDVLAQLREAGREGANAGLAGLWDGIGSALRGLLGLFPWWVWLAAGGVAFFYLGGGVWLRRKIATASA